MNNYMAHYGILGMKWGIRRAQKKGTTYSYKSLTTKVNERKANVYKSKGNIEKSEIYSNRALRSAELDAKTQKIAQGIKARNIVGFTLVGGLMQTNFGMGAYARMSAAGVSKGKSKVISILGSNLLSGTYAAIKSHQYITQDEKRIKK